MEDTTHITQAQAGLILERSERTVQRLVKRGTLRTVRLDAQSQPRLLRADVIALANSQREGGPP